MRYCVLLLGLSTLLFACTNNLGQPPPICDEVGDERLITFPFSGTADTALAWIEDQFGLTIKDVGDDLSADRAQRLIKWKSLQNRDYSAILWLDARESASVSMVWQDQPPTLSDILRCFGDPPLYNAFHSQHPEAIWTYLELWYPDRGIKVTLDAPRKISRFGNDQVISAISYVQSGPPEDLITRFSWAVERGSERYNQILQSLNPWPGDIKQIVIDERREP